MATNILTRSAKGSTLSWTEEDTNLTNLRDAIDNGLGAQAVQIASVLAGQSGGTLGFETKTAMDADLAHAAGTLARVTNDGTNNGLYIKLGASGSGSWQKSTFQDQPFTMGSMYSDNLNTAVSAIGSTPTVLLFSSDMTVGSNIVIPATLELMPINGAKINHTTYTIVYAGPTERWPLRQIFNGTGSVTLPTLARPEWFGDNITQGTTDMTTAVNKAVLASPTVVFSENNTYLVGNVLLPDRNTHIKGGREAVITGTAGAGNIFEQVNRGVLTEISGIKFTGPKTAFHRDAGTSETPYMGQFAYHEYDIHDCWFDVDTGVYALYFFGAREGGIRNNHFGHKTVDADHPAGNGIYLSYSINMEAENNLFENLGYAIYSDIGSEGLKITGGTIIGCTYGVYAYRLYGLQLKGSMIDYNDHPVLLEALESAVISGNYISSRSDSPAIVIRRKTGVEYDNTHVIIANNPEIRCNKVSFRADPTVAIRLENTNYATVSGNSVTNWRTNGIEYDDSTFVSLSGNTLTSAATYGTYSISEDSGAVTGGTITIRDNSVTLPINTPSTNLLFNNNGYLTENQGVATITEGNSSVVVTHYMGRIPSFGKVTVTPLQGGYSTYISAISSTTITISVVGTAPSGGLSFGWSASVW